MKEIIATLEYGSILTKKQNIILIFGIIIALLGPICTILMLILTCFNILELDRIKLLSTIGFNVLCALFLIVLLRRLGRNITNKRKICLWKKDFVEVLASVKVRQESKGLLITYLMQVDFEINGKFYNLEKKIGNNIIGYDKMLIQKAGKCVSIYYSKEYNQIGFIKD